jgi:hypothetical protein
MCLADRSVCCLLGLLFYPEGGSRTFLRNVGERLPDHTVSHPTHLRENLKYNPVVLTSVLGVKVFPVSDRDPN